MIADLRPILLKLCRREDLSRAETVEAFTFLTSGEATEAQIGGLLVGMASKGTTVEELVGAATVMRDRALRVEAGTGDVILDTCGTGGDVRGTFNVSTAAAIIAAAAGVRVVKHGNRSASSRSGSADVLEKLGLNLDAPVARLGACLDAAGICFAFARHHHPAMKFVGGARASLGIPTIFNLLGPLSNPAGAKHQLLGVFAPELTERFARVLKEMGSEHAWVVHAEDGLDELSTLAPTRISQLRNGGVETWTLDPEGLGFEGARMEDLQVRDLDHAARALREVLESKKGPMRDIAILNAAAALVVAEKVWTLEEGIALAGKTLDSGLGVKTLELLIATSRG